MLIRGQTTKSIDASEKIVPLTAKTILGLMFNIFCIINPNNIIANKKIRFVNRFIVINELYGPSIYKCF